MAVIIRQVESSHLSLLFYVTVYLVNMGQNTTRSRELINDLSLPLPYPKR